VQTAVRWQRTQQDIIENMDKLWNEFITRHLR
jgi:hypothetical protein